MNHFQNLFLESAKGACRGICRLARLAVVAALCFSQRNAAFAAEEKPATLRPWIAGKARLPDRISHLQDPALKKLADEAEAKLSSVADEQAGLDAEMFKRLASKSRISKGLLDLKARLLEEDFATEMATNTWESLAESYYSSVGLDSGTVAERIEAHELRLASRLDLLSSAASAYKAMVLGQKILAAELEGQLKNIARTVSNVVEKVSNQSPSPASSGVNVRARSSLNSRGETPEGAGSAKAITIETILSFFQAFDEAGKQARANLLKAGNLDAQIVALYGEIEESRDPLALSLVVPIIGSGLDDLSLGILTNHVSEMRQRVLTNFNARFCGANEKPRLSPDMQAFYDACLDVIKPILNPDFTNTCDGIREWVALQTKAPAASRLYSVPERMELHFLSRRREAVEAQKRDPKAMGMMLDDVQQETLRLAQKELETAGASDLLKRFAPPNTPTNATLGAGPELKGIISNAKNRALSVQDGGRIITAYRALAYARSMSTAKEKLPASIKQIEALAASLDQLGLQLSTELNKTLSTGGKVLTHIAEASPEGVADGIKEILFERSFWSGLDTNILGSKLIDPAKVSEKDIQFISEGINDIISQAKAEQARLLAISMELTANRTRLHQENLRHLQALGAVVSKELRRWNGLATIHERYARAYASTALNGAMEFAERGPAVSQTDLVLPTVRRLAEQARIVHWRSSDGNPAPNGQDLLAAHRHVRAAVGLIQGYFLMDVFNRKYGGDSFLWLDREIEEHDLHIVSLRNKVTESVIRLAIKDQTAFHSTGWTKEDFANLMRLLQTVGVGWIAQGN